MPCTTSRIARANLRAVACCAILLAWLHPVQAEQGTVLREPERAVFAQFCQACHAGKSAEAHLDLDAMSQARQFGDDFKDWRRVTQALRDGKMPPESETQPTAAQRAALIQAIEKGLAEFIQRYAGDPGNVVIRRLNSAEYAYTIEDLTGLDLGLEQGFVSDGVGGEGFTNVGGAQYMQDSTLERYLEAARKVAEHAVVGARPLTFFPHSGETGRELSAIARIQQLYRENGFRTAAGEGAQPFGLQLYPAAFFVAWQYRHRTSLRLGEVSLAELAQREGLSVRLAEHVWNALHVPQAVFPLSLIVSQWQALPEPREAEASQKARLGCAALGRLLREWQSKLAAVSGDEEEAAVLTAGKVEISRAHSFRSNLAWSPETTEAIFELSVTTASASPATGALVVWRNPRLRFRHVDGTRDPEEPLAEHLAAASRDRLQFGQHPQGAAIGPHDFVMSGESVISVRMPVPPETTSARFSTDVELDVEHGADCIVRCRLVDSTAAGKTAAAIGATSLLLANPASPATALWQKGVEMLADWLPEVSQREPAPSDRDPIPPPFDATYNSAERNHFHYAVKYHRDDQFLVQHVLGDETRRQLDLAWTDLLTSFDYHNAQLRFLAGKFQFTMPAQGVAELDQPTIDRLPNEARPWVQRLFDQHCTMQQTLQSAERQHVDDLLQLADRAWRRPLTKSEQQRLRDYYTQLRQTQRVEHAVAIRQLLARVLVAPAFLYRAEPPLTADPGSVGPTSSPASDHGELTVVPLTDDELASRLSYFLWSSLPDDELRRTAASGRLHDPEVLAHQARRLLRDPQARRLATEFFGQWFGFYRFDQFRGIDTGRFPEFNGALKRSMYDEAVSFFAHIVRADRPVDEILFADYAFLDQRLAAHYGIPADLPADQPQQVAQVTAQHRGGLLGLGAVLATTSAPLRTSAVKRGDWVLRRVLGTPVPPPPADAGSIVADDARKDGRSIRQLLESHRTQATCVNCHQRIDPLGFALEHYDPIGRWRDTYRDGQPIDATGVLSDGTEIAGLAGLRQYLQRQEPQFQRTLCVKLLGYALGRGELASDGPLIEQMLADLGDDERFSRLVVRIVTSRQFGYRRR